MSSAEPAVASPEAPRLPDYQPETPFASDGFARSSATSPAVAFGPSFEIHTPFLSEYGLDGGKVVGGPRAEFFASLMAELHEPEFEDAVADLVNEAAVLAQEQLGYEGEDAADDRQNALRGLREVLAPLQRECEAALDRMAGAIGETDLSAMTEGEFEEYLDRLTPTPTSLPPAFEDFLGKLIKKAKKAVSGVVKLAKKGVQLAGKLSPVHLILGRLKALVKPLLERVLKFALDKLPVAIRPAARQLATRLLGMGEAESLEDYEDDEAAAADPAVITRELDAKLAGYAFEGEDFDRSFVVDRFVEEEEAFAAGTWRRLQRARSRFAKRVVSLPPGADPAPVVEEFVPAILAALKLGIRVIGRQRVVGFLAGLVAKLIGKYVGQAQAAPLSKALVDVGMRVVGLEAPSDGGALAGEALAATVEDTVSRVVQNAPEAAWESEALLEDYVREAFAHAASANFPDTYIRPELHEAAESSGAWEFRPLGATNKLYKKYSRVLEVTLTPQVVAAVRSFGGTALTSVIREQLGIALSGPLRARAHLFEAIGGTTLPSIAASERDVRGLGSPARASWSLIHPLTPEAAGLLFKEPALGKTIDPRFLADRNVIERGQRFYYLDFPNAALRARGGPRAALPRETHAKVVLDFPAGLLRVLLFYSEADAQALAAKLRTRAPAGVILGALKSGIESRLRAILSGMPTRALRIVHEAVPAESLLPQAAGLVLRTTGRWLSGTVLKFVLQAMKGDLERRYDGFAADVVQAAESNRDGISMVLTFSRPAFLEPLRALLSGKSPALGAAKLGALRPSLGEYGLSIRPGHVRA